MTSDSHLFSLFKRLKSIIASECLSIIILFLLVTFKLLFLAFPDIALVAAREGLLLWFNNVMPALLPFMIIVNMIVSLGFAHVLGGLLTPVMRRIFGLPGIGGFVLITGLTSGYPMGAKVVSDLRKTGDLSMRDAQHLLAFCNNAGPLFILGVVGVGLFGSSTAGYVLWAGHVIAAMILGILLKRNTFSTGRVSESTEAQFPKPAFTRQPKNFKISIGTALGSAVKNAMESMAIIGGLIIFFNVIVAVLGKVGLPDTGLLAGVLSGVIEVTGGVRKISGHGISALNLGLAAFAIAFGGLSIHMQTFHFTEGTGVKVIPYLFCKVLHGVIAAAVTVILWSFV